MLSQVIRLIVLLVLAAGCGASPPPAPEPNPTDSTTDPEPAEAKLTAQEIIEALDLPVGIELESSELFATKAFLSSKVAPAVGWRTWQVLDARADELGMVPVVLDAAMLEGLEKPLSPSLMADEQQRAASLTPEAFFAARANQKDEWIAILAAELDVPVDSLPPMTWDELQARCKQAGFTCPNEDPHGDYLAELDAEVDGSFLAGEVTMSTPFFVTRNEEYEKQGLKADLRVRVLLAASKPAYLPILLQMGGWNEMPYPHEHAVVLSRWAAEYGARIVFYGGDIIQMVVDRPPRTLAELRQLTREQYLYCNDIVTQGVGSTSELARTLVETTTWYFWWD